MKISKTLLALITFASTGIQVCQAQGWVISDEGQSCNEACVAKSNEACNAEGTNNAMDKTTVEYVFDTTFGFTCDTTTMAESAHDPTFDPTGATTGHCQYSDGTSTCESFFFSGTIRRLCCCSDEVDPRMDCLVNDGVPSDQPTASPTFFPTDFPTLSPTAFPTVSPTAFPTLFPTLSPTDQPSDAPTDFPTDQPSDAPTESPTVSPEPTQAPTEQPTVSPTEFPTEQPTVSPTEFPTASPSLRPTDAPTSAPTDASGSSPSCFSGTSIAQVLHQGPTLMKDLKLNDKIYTGISKANGLPQYDDLYAFGHLDTSTPTEYLKISIDQSNTTPLEISGAHLLFLSGKTDPVRADSIHLGDTLLYKTVDGPTKEVVVTKVEKIIRKGAYMPLTTRGSIVVNGIQASTYVSISDEAPGVTSKFQSFLSEHDLLHIWLSPLRLACTVSSKICENNHNEDGVMTWLAAGKYIAEVGESWGLVVQMVGIATVTMAMAVSITLEAVFSSFGGLLLLAGLAIMVVSKKDMKKKVD